MAPQQRDSFILIAEDDADDRYLLQTAFDKISAEAKLQFVENGVDLLEYLYSLDSTTDINGQLPKLIMLDLNMPKKDGREVLKEIKQQPALKKIPIVIFSTTSNEQEMSRCYELGADAYITKPNNFQHLIDIISTLNDNWLRTPAIS